MSLENFIEPLLLSQDRLPDLALALSKKYQELAKDSSEQFLATPVNVLPNGSETGRMLAIDVGGSNLRVGFVDLLGGSKIARSYDQTWRIEDDVRLGKDTSLFQWIGDRIAEVVAARQRDLAQQGKGEDALGEVLPLGIAWSFPLRYGEHCCRISELLTVLTSQQQPEHHL